MDSTSSIDTAEDRDRGDDRQAPAEQPVVLVRGVSLSYGRGRTRRQVLQDLSLSAHAGTSIWIGGSNGAGKTTLLRVITGILIPAAGEAYIDGLRAERQWREFHRRVGFLSAGDRGLYARLTVRAHLDYWATVAFVPREKRQERIEAALSAFGLAELSDRRSERLSQGQRQRLRLALTLVHEPRVLLLDEPRNSLDPEGLERLAEGAHGVMARGGTVIWCSPPAEQQPIAFHRELTLEQGRLRPA